MFADSMQHFISHRGRGRVRVRGLGTVGRARVGDQRWARRPVRARGVGRRAQLRSRGGAGGCYARLRLSASGRVCVAGPERRGGGRRRLVGRRARSAAQAGATRPASLHAAPRLRHATGAHAGARRDPARAALLRRGERVRLAAGALGAAGGRAGPQRGRAAALLPRAALLLQHGGFGGVRGGARGAVDVARRRGAVRRAVRAARAGGPGACGARPAAGGRRAAGRARRRAAAGAGAVSARAPAAALQGVRRAAPHSPSIATSGQYRKTDANIQLTTLELD